VEANRPHDVIAAVADPGHGERAPPVIVTALGARAAAAALIEAPLKLEDEAEEVAPYGASDVIPTISYLAAPAVVTSSTPSDRALA
jgi:hypothetical protein